MMNQLANSFVIMLREDVLYVSPKKIILLYFERDRLKSFESYIGKDLYNDFKKYNEIDSIHNKMIALGKAFELKNNKEGK